MKSASSVGGTVLGIDPGSSALSMVLTDTVGNILDTQYLFHNGRVRDCLEEAGNYFDLSQLKGIACVSSPFFRLQHVRTYDPQVSLITAARKLCPEARSILHVGAEKFMVLRLDANGKYDSTSINSSCAAGTGSFLEQQAFRLHLSGIVELSSIAFENCGPVPDIASRCAVFAKTDLIHAQQQGYSLPSVCDSLCKGLARNITDTLFSKEMPAGPVLFTGGVSMNQAVRRHLEELMQMQLLAHPCSHLFGAIGAAFMMIAEKTDHAEAPLQSLAGLLPAENGGREYQYAPLSLELSDYPDFTCLESAVFSPVAADHPVAVQTDQYEPFVPGADPEAFLGIDIGSTSTKAMLLGRDGRPLAGFYTSTSGRPLQALQAIFEAMDDLCRRKNTGLTILAAGTTGSGRKFIGQIIRADLVLDEVTAHARAAFELDPATDTIIEIGGQDAKFTLMREGRVIFSQMNTVCAAGTGSFIEEQARKLGCSLEEFPQKAEGTRAPLASDRCTVFMERDLNHLLNKGYSVNEVLATVLHSVRENYLKKVATEGAIGDRICFQGATARNRALVAAFEQKLGKRIFVSKYCHLTGAMGVALVLRDEMKGQSTFRGIGLYRENIPLSNETCTICNNRCHISLAEVQGGREAYGFLCGRDYDTKKFLKPDASSFILTDARRKVLEVKKPAEIRYKTTIGLPATLYMFEEMGLWKRFFANLSVRTVTSEDFAEPVKTGKRLAGAEFCAPIDALYGHAHYLAGKCDLIFMPVYLESRDKPKGALRNYCYYSQFGAPLVHTMKDPRVNVKCLSPLLNLTRGSLLVARQLHRALKEVLGPAVTYLAVLQAYEEAVRFARKQQEGLQGIFLETFGKKKELSVVLLGRPYVVLSSSMNKNIPGIFAGMGIRAFYQDMVPGTGQPPEEVDAMLQKIPWHFAARIMETARNAAVTPELYPVLITTFKCAPDSFIIEYFKKMMNQYRKPYLILQVDEHDSSVGYETRIEAALRSFRNHAASVTEPVEASEAVTTAGFSILPVLETKINGKTLLFPGWDPIIGPLLVANLKRNGIDARLMDKGEMIIRRSMAHNTGQCLPLNIILQEFMDYISNHGLKPENTLLWMTGSFLACNLSMYAWYAQSLLESYGRGFGKARVYLGDLTHLEISFNACYYAYFAYMLGGLIRRLGCRIRPYEENKGETDRVIKRSTGMLEEAFLGHRSMDEAITTVVALFDAIPQKPGNRPKVAIFGDFYVRDNDVMNQDLIHAIEAAGGEAITTPYNDYVKITVENVIRRCADRGDYFETGLYKVLITGLKLLEDRYYKHFRKHLGDPPVISPKRLEKHLSTFGIHPLHAGESYENILKIFYILENHPDVALFVQANPAFCCPSLITEAMTHEIRRITGVQVVTLTYDGTSDYKNDVLVPYLHALKTV